MKTKILYSVAIAFMASGMALAQSSGQGTTGQDSMDSQTGTSTASAPQMSGATDQQADMAVSKEDETQSEQAMQPDRSGYPGAMAVPTEAEMNALTEAEINARQNDNMKEDDETYDCDDMSATDPSCAR